MKTPHFRTEAAAVLTLAGPLILSQLAGIGMGAVDTMMAGQVGREALAAVALGTNVNTVFFVLVTGVLMSGSAIVAQLRGARAADETIGAFGREALSTALLLAVAWVALAHLLAQPVLSRLGLAAGTEALAVEYLKALSWSGIGMSLWAALRFCAEGSEVTVPVLFSSVSGLLCNAGLNWVLVFGHLGAPAMGAVGCGWATALTALLMAGLLAASYLIHPRLRALRLFQARGFGLGPHAASILRVGSPIGTILLAESGLFVATALLTARFGETAVAAFQIALNFAAVLFMIPLGIGLATTVRVGHAIGAGSIRLPRYRGVLGMSLALANAAFTASLMLWIPGPIVSLYTDDREVADLAVRFLGLAAAFQFFDGLQAAANGALRGLKDTRVPMLITVAAYWLIGLPVGVGLAFAAGQGPQGLWWGLCAGLGAAGLGLAWRFLARTHPAKGLESASA